MKKLAEVSATLGLHPANALLFLASSGVSFEELWPEIDETWINVIRSLDWQRFGVASGAEEVGAQNSMVSVSASTLTDSALQVLSKLWRQDRWGKLGVSEDTLRRHTCPNVKGLDEAVKELLNRELIEAGGHRGPYSLNPSKKGEIDRLARSAIESKKA